MTPQCSRGRRSALVARPIIGQGREAMTGHFERVIWVDASPYGLSAVAENGDLRWKGAAGTGHSMLDEMHAIGLAIEWLAETRSARSLILCDSTGAVKAMHGRIKYGPTGLHGLAEGLRADLGQHYVAWVPRSANAAANAHARRDAGGADRNDVASLSAGSSGERDA